MQNGTGKKIELLIHFIPLNENSKGSNKGLSYPLGQLTITKNQSHAKDNFHKCPTIIVKKLKQQIKLLEKQISQVEDEIKLVVKNDKALDERIRKIETMPGVGFMIIACILGENNAFTLVHNSTNNW